MGEGRSKKKEQREKEREGEKRKGPEIRQRWKARAPTAAGHHYYFYTHSARVYLVHDPEFRRTRSRSHWVTATWSAFPGCAAHPTFSSAHTPRFWRWTPNWNYPLVGPTERDSQSNSSSKQAIKPTKSAVDGGDLPRRPSRGWMAEGGKRAEHPTPTVPAQNMFVSLCRRTVYLPTWGCYVQLLVDEDKPKWRSTSDAHIREQQSADQS
jgi:hypothetical protein